MDYIVTVASEWAALQRLVPQWEELAAAGLEPNPFFEHWLLLPALRAFGATDNVRIVCVSRNGKLCGLFPFRLVSRYKGIPVKALVSWRNPHGLLCTPLVARDTGRECLEALFLWLKRERAATLIEFDCIPIGGPFHQALVDALNRGDHRARLGDAYTRGLLCRDGGAEAYINTSLSSDSRQKMRRYERRLGEQGHVTHRVLQATDDVQAWTEEFLRVEASGWKGANGTALGCTEPDRRFVEEAFRAAFSRGRLIMVGIDLDGRPIARYCGLVAGEGSYAFKTAYDEAFRRFAPGLLAELDMVRAVHTLPGVQWMDSLAGHRNSTIDRLWKHRLIVQRLAVGAGSWGEFVVHVVLPLLQWTKHAFRRLAQSLPSMDEMDNGPFRPDFLSAPAGNKPPRPA